MSYGGLRVRFRTAERVLILDHWRDRLIRRNVIKIQHVKLEEGAVTVNNLQISPG